MQPKLVLATKSTQQVLSVQCDWCEKWATLTHIKTQQERDAFQQKIQNKKWFCSRIFPTKKCEAHYALANPHDVTITKEKNGQTVPVWSLKQEKEKAKKLFRNFNKKITRYNTILATQNQQAIIKELTSLCKELSENYDKLIYYFTTPYIRKATRILYFFDTTRMQKYIDAIDLLFMFAIGQNDITGISALLFRFYPLTDKTPFERCYQKIPRYYNPASAVYRKITLFLANYTLISSKYPVKKLLADIDKQVGIDKIPQPAIALEKEVSNTQEDNEDTQMTKATDSSIEHQVDETPISPETRTFIDSLFA